MIFRSGLTNQFCFAYTSKKNEGENERRVDSCSGEHVGPLEISHIQCGDLEIKNPILKG